MILPPYQERIYACIAKKARSLGAVVHAVGGVADHIHLVVSVPPRVAIASFIGQVKGASAHFVNYEIIPDFSFAWQEGYGIVSLGEGQLHSIIRYVHNQSQHHGESSTIDELEALEA